MFYAYVVAAVFITGLGVGAIGQYKLDAAEIQGLKSAIVEGNTKAEYQLHEAQAKVEAATQKATELASQLDKSHKQSISTINSLHERVVAAGRVYAGRQNCPNTVPKGNSPRESKATAEPTDFSGRLAEIVQRADRAAVYAQECWRFVTANCGVQ